MTTDDPELRRLALRVRRRRLEHGPTPTATRPSPVREAAPVAVLVVVLLAALLALLAALAFTLPHLVHR